MSIIVCLSELHKHGLYATLPGAKEETLRNVLAFDGSYSGVP